MMTCHLSIRPATTCTIPRTKLLAASRRHMAASYWTAASDVVPTSAPVSAAGHRSTLSVKDGQRRRPPVNGGDRRSRVAVNDGRRWRTTVDCRWTTGPPVNGVPTMTCHPPIRPAATCTVPRTQIISRQLRHVAASYWTASSDVAPTSTVVGGLVKVSDSLLLTPLCCDDIHDVTPRVSALAGSDTRHYYSRSDSSSRALNSIYSEGFDPLALVELITPVKGNKGQSISTPMATKPKLDADLSGNPIDQTDYRSKIGSLMYLTSSRPDIVQAISFCARYQSRPTEKPDALILAKALLEEFNS
nr:uncharacterized mitochondrial protein AtMg00810-like [Tanacetum cinerariifolium]